MSETKLGSNSTISDMGLEEEYKEWLRNSSDGGKEITSINTYWSLIHQLPAFDFLDEDHTTIANRLAIQINKEKKITAAANFIQFLYSHYQDTGEINEENLDEYRSKTREIIGSLNAMRQMKEAELDTGSDYDTVEEHYIHKANLVELLERVDPKYAKFYAFQYYGGFRFKEVKLIREKEVKGRNGIRVEEHGGVRIKKTRSKSKFPRTVSFRSETPMKLLQEQLEKTGNWEDDEDRVWEDVIFSDVQQSKLNYRLGKKMNRNGKTKVYGAYGQITGEMRTLHSLRHTRITDLSMATDMATKDIKQRSGHSRTETTDEYTEQNIENPQTLESYCEENDIDIMEVINKE